MEEDPLPSPSISAISIRLAFFLLLLSVALYANHESSRNIDVTISADVSAGFAPSRTFHLQFIANGRASRILLESSARMQKIVIHPKRPIRHVHLQLATHNLPEPVTVACGSGSAGTFVILLSPGVLLEKDGVKLVELELRKAMERVWIRVAEGSSSDPDFTGRPMAGTTGNLSTSAVGPRQVM